MKSTRRILIFSVLSIMTVSFFAANTYAACTGIPSGSYPKTLVANTTYCLTSNVVVAAGAFLIAGDNITLDLAGFEIRGSGFFGAIGTDLNAAYKNIIIKNGRINGFSMGIGMQNGYGGYHRNVVIDGISFQDIGNAVVVSGKDVIIRNCKIHVPNWGGGRRA